LVFSVEVVKWLLGDVVQLLQGKEEEQAPILGAVAVAEFLAHLEMVAVVVEGCAGRLETVAARAGEVGVVL
jgi:hypothetical protein